MKRFACPLFVCVLFFIPLAAYADVANDPVITFSRGNPAIIIILVAAVAVVTILLIRKFGKRKGR